MKIALINKVISQRGGGGERYAVDLARYLLSFDCQIHAYGQILENLPPEVHRHIVSAPTKPGFRKIRGFIQKVRSALAGQHYDVIYSLTQFYPTDLYFMGGGMHEHWMHIREPNPLIRHLRYLINPTHLVQREIEQQLCHVENCRAIIANSNMVKRHAMHYGKIPANRIHVIHNGIDRDIFNSEVRQQYRSTTRQALNLSNDQIAILFIAHNWQRKGLATLLQALGTLIPQAPRYQLLVVGRGRAASFSKIIAQHQLDSHVQFIGPVDAPQLYYAAADLMVLPTMYDPCAGVTLEAMACGLPVITTESNGASELMDDQCGYILENYADSKTLSQYLLYLADDQRRLKMGRHAATIMERHSFQNVAQKVYQIMQKIAAKRQPLAEEGFPQFPNYCI